MRHVDVAIFVISAFFYWFICCYDYKKEGGDGVYLRSRSFVLKSRQCCICFQSSSLALGSRLYVDELIGKHVSKIRLY